MLVAAQSKILIESRKYFPRFGSWLEQSGVNAVAQRSKERVKMLPRSMNFLIGAHINIPSEQAQCHAVNIHFCNSGRKPGLLPKLHRKMARIVDKAQRA
jgi:elongation factor P hydroxylase